MTVNALPAKGFGVADFESVKSDVKEDTGFTDSIADGEEAAESFAYPVLMDDDTVITVRFKEELKEEATDEEVKDAEDGKTEGTEEVTDAEDKTDAAEDKADAENTEDKAEGTEESADATKPTEGEEDLLIGQPEKSDGEDAEVTEGEDDLLIGQPEDTEAPEGEDDLLIEKPENTEDEDDLLIEQPEDSENTEGEEVTDDETNADESEDTLIEDGEDAEEITEDTETTELEEASVDHFAEIDEAMIEDIAKLNSDDFSSGRLVILTDNPDVIVDPEHQLANYGNIYLMQYKSAEQAMNAYVYYALCADAVEPDMPMEAASEDLVGMEAGLTQNGETENITVPETVTETGNEIPAEPETEQITVPETDIPEAAPIEAPVDLNAPDVEVTEDVNPIATLAETDAMPEAPSTRSRVIALIDTGTSEHPNVINRVSLIDDALEGHGHGDEMVDAIVSQNPEAQIISIRTMGNDGRGTVSSIIAGMEYAIEQGVEIINLSLYNKTNLANSVLATEIQKAIDAGIDVVGAAGNDGEDVKDYMPGCIETAWIIGAASETGELLNGSNYGATVDFNVIAGTTSEATAKFSGFISLYGTSDIPVNEGLIYATDYIAEITEPEIPEELPEDIPMDEEEWKIGNYPISGSSKNKTEYVWVRDTAFDFLAYNSYSTDGNVKVVRETEPENVNYTVGGTVEMTYKYSLIDTPDYSWKEFVTFEFVDERTIATIGSEMLEKLLPEYVNQERNEGYNGIVPSMVGEVVKGKTYTVIANTEGFDIDGLLLDYNPHTFKVNHTQYGGFDITKPGTYTVIHEMSHFMYYNYTWFVESTVNVVDPAALEPGIYLTSKESTLMMTRQSDSMYGGYGDLMKMENPVEKFILSCIDAGYEADVVSSDESLGEFWSIQDNGDETKSLTVNIPDGIDHAVILSLFRPNYQAQKMFTGGGWQDPELAESDLNNLSEDDFSKYEDELSGESDSDEYMNIAGDWITTAKANITSTLVAGGQTGHNYDPYGPCTNYGTVQAVSKADTIVQFAKDNKVTINKADIKNFYAGCATGHDYAGLSPGKTYYGVTIRAEVQQNGADYRVRLSIWWSPGGGYQTFAGSYYITGESKATLTVDKKLKLAYLANESGRIGPLKTSFGVYTHSSCDDKYLETTIKIDAVDAVTAHGTVDLVPGTYWVKETRRIDGCAPVNTIWGPCKLNPGDNKRLHQFVPDTEHEEMSMDASGWVLNIPYTYKLEILTKVDAETGEPVTTLGAVFKIEYSERNKDAWKTVRTWYMSPNNKDVLDYRPEFLADGYKSDELFYYSAEKKPYQAALPVGYLRITEVKAPEGYDINPKVYERPLLPKKNLDGTPSAIPDCFYYGDEDRSHWKFQEPESGPKWEFQLHGKKVNSTMEPLEGAEFGVYYDKECQNSVFKNGRILPDEKTQTHIVKSGPDGMTDILTVRYFDESTEKVTVYVKELKAPGNCALLTTVFPVEFTYEEYVAAKEAWTGVPEDFHGVLKPFGPEEGIINEEGWKVRLEGKKVDADHNPLAGAEFSVYWDSACTELIGTFTSDADGMLKYSFGVPLDKENITVYIKETKAPDGYGPETENEIFKVDFSKADYDALSEEEKLLGLLGTFGPEDGIPNITVTPGPPSPSITPPTSGSGGLTIIKKSKAEQPVLDLDYYKLEGAVFEISSSDPASFPTQTVTTGPDGIAGPISLPDNHKEEWVPPVIAYKPDGTPYEQTPGYNKIISVTTTYTITEITPPQGHKPYEGSPKTITVTMPKDNGASFSVQFDDEPIFTEMDLEKLDVKGNRLEGVVFRAEYFDGESPDAEPVRTWYLESDAGGHVKIDEAHLTDILKWSSLSDPLYTHKFNDGVKAVLPVGGYLQLTEVDAPAEYKIDDTPIGAPTKEGEIWTPTFKKFYNDIERCTINLVKLEENGYTPIEGVEFKLTFLKEAITTQPDALKFTPLLKEGESRVFSTDANGELALENLDQGQYRLVEIQTKPGHSLLKDPIDIIINLPMKMTEAEADAYGNVDYSHAKEDESYSKKWYFYDVRYEITNTPNFTLPVTGSNGVWKYGIMGMTAVATIATGIIIMETNKKKRRKMKRKKPTHKI